MIARHFIDTNVDVKMVLSLVGESMGVIGIEDLLPFLIDLLNWIYSKMRYVKHWRATRLRLSI